jgi:hypothetical protein
MSKLETNTIDTVSGTSTLQVGSTNTSTITLGVSGDTINVPSGVTINNNGTQTGFGGTNTPSFFAFNDNSQNASNDTATKLAFRTEVWDVGGVYDHGTYKFTPGFTGKSNISCGFWSYDAQSKIYRHDVMLFKNGSQLTSFENRFTSSDTTAIRKWIDFNMNVSHDDNDYFEVYGLFATTDSGSADIISSSGNTTQYFNYFTAFKIIE